MLGHPMLFDRILRPADVGTIRLFGAPKPIAVKMQPFDRFLNLAGKLQQVWILCDSTPRGNRFLDLPPVRRTNTVVAMAKVNKKLLRANGELALAAHDHLVFGELKKKLLGGWERHGGVLNSDR